MRIQNSVRICELLAELTYLQWDIISVNETRAISQEMDFQEGHRLIAYRENYKAAGLGILLHSQLVPCIAKQYFISDRILRIDLRIGKRILSIYSVYVPHAGFPNADLDLCLHGAI